MKKILIETNENDYMTYFELAASSLSDLLKDWDFDWTEKELKDNFMALTKSFYFIIKKEEICEGQVTQMYNDLEVYIGEDSIKEWKKDGGNGSEVYI
jgi:hypothetical protein